MLTPTAVHVRHRRFARALAAGTALGLLMTGCGSGDPDGGRSGDARTVEVAGAYGEVSVPVTDAGVWALDPTSAVELLALGVRPTHAGRHPHEGDAAYQAREGILEEAGVELVAPDKVELILEHQPDLIVGSQSPATDEGLNDLKQIAPVLITDATAPWDDSLTVLGRATGRDEQAQALIEHLEAQVDDTRQRIQHAGYGGETVSMISSCGAGNVCVYDSGRTAGALLTELGFRRPAGQQTSDSDYGFTTVSTEKLDSLVAPINVILTGSVQFGARSPLDNPLYDVSDAIVGEVDFAAWYGAGSFDVPWILNDVRALLLDEGTIAGKDDGARLFGDLRSAVS